jgi:hypothetical protein
VSTPAAGGAAAGAGSGAAAHDALTRIPIRGYRRWV